MRERRVPFVGVLAVLLAGAVGVSAQEQPAAEAAKPTELSPERKQQLRVLFEPIRKTVERAQKAEAKTLKAAQASDIAKMQSTMAEVKAGKGKNK